MASLEEFESTLKEVVGAKRVSASKMTSLTDLALKSMDNDTQLVSILYRTHKSLPTPAKVSSLYAFDSLARAARSKVTKHNLTGDVNSEKGNCATFLLKVEGVLDGLFQDMLTSGSTESKEKSKKILDIWTKSNTFPSAVLTRLRDLVKDAEKESNKVVTAIADPRTVNQSPPSASITTPTPPLPSASATPATVDPAQSTLLALLSQAANVGALNHQTPPNTGTQAAQPQLDPTHFALLQQLAQTAKLGNGQTIPLPIQSLAPSAGPGPPGAFGGPLPHPPLRDDRYNSVRGDPRYGRYDNQVRGRGRGDYYEDRSSYRGNYKGGGGFRGRGRGSYDDRSYYRDREGYRSSPPRPRRSRSRSPSSRHGGGGRRDVKPYSPPQRPTIAPSPMPVPDRQASSHSADSVLVSPTTKGGQKDEFGRDIRPQSPEEAVTEVRAQPPPVPASIEQNMPAPAIAKNQIPSVPQQTASVAAANTSTQNHNAPVVSQPGLDKFDMSTFDFTASSSWEALGKMWQVTYGYLPSQEELMQFVMSGGVIASAAAAGMIPGQYQNGMLGMEQGWPQSGGGLWAGPGPGGGGMRGGYPNRGGGPAHGNGNGRNSQQQRGGYTGYQQDSDAVVLGGGDISNENDMMQIESPPPAQASPPSGEGRMQRVGDGWMFTRDAVTKS